MYNISKELIPRRKEKHVTNPYNMIFCNNHYYLVCIMDGKEDLILYRSLYRIDRIRDIEICQEMRKEEYSNINLQ